MLFKLLSAPFTLPLSGIKFAMQQIADMAEQELNDDSVVHEQLILLQVQLEEGDIDEEEFVEREAELMVRLREIKARRRAELEQVSPDEIPAEANVEARRRVIVETPFDE
jgi:hypothetical protein